eukprot:TRINITY_DN2430_c0_g1_i1.p1 TRINITY_DN2430_c0_g1~~TRINITY_DN2430_c0_g1_i1.p1  ORF type:complete len:310 (-),score=110.84 TRINITY_DN2430_c0_g1_i1:140-958(-)
MSVNPFQSRPIYAETVKGALDPQNFVAFKLKSVRDVNHNTRIYTFDLGDPKAIIGLDVASCLVTKANIGENGKPVIRPYTPVSSNDEKGVMELMVKEYPNGVMSKHIANLKPGDTLEMKGPIPKIRYTPNMKKKIGMICGGTGLTPMLQVVRAILKNPEDKTDVTLVFANVTEEDILIKDEIDALAKKHKNFHVKYVLEKPPKGWKGYTGYVSEAIIKETMPSAADGNLVMVCGPPPMMKAISGDKAPDYSQGEVDGLLKKLGYNKDQVYKF